MKKVLLLGGAGFIGKNVLQQLRALYDVSAPARAQLNLSDADAVRSYLENGRFDAVVHLANPTAQNPVDKKEDLFELSLRVFLSITHCAGLYGKLIYMGSGAEYGKHRAIEAVREEAFGDVLPKDGYGLSRYVMNGMCAGRRDVTNLRLFACCGPGDPPHKLIPHILSCIGAGKPIALRQDVYFDFIYVTDVASALIHFIENDAAHQAYNLCSGKPIRISEIAAEVKRQTGSDMPVVFERDGLAPAYTGSCARLKAEFAGWQPTSVRDSVTRILRADG